MPRIPPEKTQGPAPNDEGDTSSRRGHFRDRLERGLRESLAGQSSHTAAEGDMGKTAPIEWDDGSTGPSPNRLIDELAGKLAGVLDEADVPKELGSYRLGPRIGSGGMGTLFLATHAATGTRAAIKVAALDDASAAAALLQEAEGLARVEHRNVVRILDRGKTDRYVWIAVELVDGRSLADVIREENTPGAPEAARPTAKDRLRVKVRWFREVALALDAMHEAGLVHRDVKPGNIMIDKHGNAYLIDLGLAIESGDWLEGVLSGTIPYMSPEQTLGGYVGLTAVSDIYSLAVTFHECLSGVAVAARRGRAAILQQIAFVPVPPPSDVSPAVPASLDPIFNRALAKHPQDRYLSAKQLAEDLDDWLEGRAPRHARVPVLSRISRWAARHRMISAAIAACLIVAAGFGVRGLWDSTPGAEARLREAEELASREEYGRALSALAGGLDDFDPDTRARIAKEFIPLGASKLSDEMVAGQSFAANRESETLLSYEKNALGLFQLAQNPEFLFQISFSRVLRNDYEGVVHLLAKHPDVARRSRATQLVKALAAAGLDQKESAAKIADQVETRPSQPLSDVERCMWAYYVLWNLHCGTPVTPAMIEFARECVSDVIARRPDHQFARVLRGAISLQVDEEPSADVDFQAVITSPDGRERPGTRAACAVALLYRVASRKADAARRWDELLTQVRKALAADPRTIWYLSHQLLKRLERAEAAGGTDLVHASETISRWCADVLAFPREIRVEFSGGFLQLVGDVINKRLACPRPTPADSRRIFLEVGELVALLDRRCDVSALGPGDRENWQEAQSMRGWMHVFLGDMDVEAKPPDLPAARVHADQAARVVKETIDRGGHWTYLGLSGVEAYAALLAYKAAPAEIGSDQKEKLRLRARERLARLCDERVVEEARKNLDTGRFAANLIDLQLARYRHALSEVP